MIYSYSYKCALHFSRVEKPELISIDLIDLFQNGYYLSSLTFDLYFFIIVIFFSQSEMIQ